MKFVEDFGPAYTNSLPKQPCIIPNLLGLLGQTRRAKNIPKTEIVRKLPFPVNQRQIQNWEWGQTAPPSGRLDVIVATYAATTNTIVSALWGEALTRAISDAHVQGIEWQEIPDL